MHADRFIRMQSARMLDCVGVDRELVDLPENDCIAEFSTQYLGVDLPALRGSIVIPAIRCRLAGRHRQSASRTDHLAIVYPLIRLIHSNPFIESCQVRESRKTSWELVPVLTLHFLRFFSIDDKTRLLRRCGRKGKIRMGSYARKTRRCKELNRLGHGIPGQKGGAGK